MWPMDTHRRDFLSLLVLASAADAEEPKPEPKMPKAYADIQEASGRLRDITVPRDLEPAFSFRP